MKIELVGGALCGEIFEVKHLEAIVTMGPSGAYARRDKAWTLSEKFGGLYGERGYRIYDHVKEFVVSE